MWKRVKVHFKTNVTLLYTEVKVPVDLSLLSGTIDIFVQVWFNIPVFVNYDAEKSPQPSYFKKFLNT